MAFGFLVQNAPTEAQVPEARLETSLNLTFPYIVLIAAQKALATLDFTSGNKHSVLDVYVY